MSRKGDAGHYGPLAAGLHWASAVGILTMFPLGFAAAHASDPAHAARLLRLHLPIGILVLLLILARCAWSFFDRRPDPPPGQPRWQHASAVTTHVMLYFIVIALCASGMVTVALSNAAPVIFSGAPAGLPRFEQYPSMRGHVVFSLVLLVLIGVHVGAVIYHFVRGDRPFQRMRILSGGERP